MKLVALLCVLAVACGAPIPSRRDRRPLMKLKEVLRELNVLKAGLQDAGSITLNAPPLNTEDGCCALECFRSSLIQLNITSPRGKIYKGKLDRSLRNQLTKSGVGCGLPGDVANAGCDSCGAAYPNATLGFVQNLETFIHKAISKW